MNFDWLKIRKHLVGYVIYLGAGLAGVISAFYLSTWIMAPVQSQEPPPPPPVPNAEELVPAEETTGNNSGDLIRENFVTEVQSYLEPFIYDPKGRRDPFGPYVEPQEATEGFQGPLLPLQRFDIQELKLIGIMWNIADPKAMFVDPNSQIHVVGKDERIGRNNGYIAVIREGEVVIVEASRRKGDLVYSSRVVRLEQ